jgi:hypothetical protein
MTASVRYRQPWSSTEVNRLYSEYELRQLPILDIAKLHKRGEHAILHRLAKEGLILETWSDVRGWNVNDAKVLKPVVNSPRINVVNTVFFSQESDESLEDNDDPNDSDYVYESDEDDEDDFSVVDSDADEFSEDSDDDSDYVDDAESVDSDSDYEDEFPSKTTSENEEYDPYSIKQKAKFIQNIISALKFFVYAA